MPLTNVGLSWQSNNLRGELAFGQACRIFVIGGLPLESWESVFIGHTHHQNTPALQKNVRGLLENRREKHVDNQTVSNVYHAPTGHWRQEHLAHSQDNSDSDSYWQGCESSCWMKSNWLVELIRHTYLGFRHLIVCLAQVHHLKIQEGFVLVTNNTDFLLRKFLSAEYFVLPVLSLFPASLQLVSPIKRRAAACRQLFALHPLKN